MGKGKSKIFPVLMHCAMKMYKDSGGKAPSLTTDVSELSATWSGNLNTKEKSPWVPMDRKQGVAVQPIVWSLH
jgi:hypothetical protein